MKLIQRETTQGFSSRSFLGKDDAVHRADRYALGATLLVFALIAGLLIDQIDIPL